MFQLAQWMEMKFWKYRDCPARLSPAHVHQAVCLRSYRGWSPPPGPWLPEVLLGLLLILRLPPLWDPLPELPALKVAVLCPKACTSPPPEPVGL